MSGMKLVMGASGFLGSHVTRQLVELGDEVRVWIRQSSSTLGIDDLEVERHHVDLDIQTALDHSKATRELGWEPSPVEGSIRAGVRLFLDQGNR